MAGKVRAGACGRPIARRRLSGALFLGGSAIAAAAQAQSPVAPAAPANTLPSQAATADAQLGQPANTTAGAGLGDIVVTAQRRTERLRDVPIAVSAFSADALQSRNITTVNSLEGFVPNVKIFTQGYATSTSIAIRGSVVTNNAPYFEPVVGLYVDGVYIGKARGAAFDNIDVERIEVLRGPQGTLYGRNTLAGAVNIITARPTGEWGGVIKGGIGSYGQYFVQGALNLPALETGIGAFKVKVSGRRERRKGTRNIPNPFPQVTTARAIKQDHLDSIDSWSGQVAVRWQPSPSLTVDYNFDRSDQSNSQLFAQLINLDAGGVFDPTSRTYNGIPLSLYLKPNGRDTTSSVNGGDLPGLIEPQLEHADVYGHALTTTLDLGQTTIKSITSFRRLHFREVKDFDGSPLQLITTSLAYRPRAFSQELQATGTATDKLNYTAGLYYYNDKGDIKSFQSFFGGLTDVQYGYGTGAYAGYGQLDYKLTDALTLTGGLRYNRETKRVRRVTRNALTNVTTVPFVSGEKTFDGWQPTAIVKYDVTATLNLYAKYAKGFKSGGFNAEAPNGPETLVAFRPESVDSFEIGSKSQFADNRVQLNLAAFYDKHTDLQLSVFDPRATTAASVVRNAGKADISGFEIELQAAPTRWLRLQGSLGYLHTRYKQFISGGVDVADDRAFPYAPEVTTSVSADALLVSFGDAEVRLIVDYAHSDGYFIFPFSLNPASVQNAQRSRVGGSDVVDARLRLTGVETGAGRIEASVAVKNLFNDDYRVGAVDFGSGFFGGLITGFYGRPRIVSADLALRF